MNTSVNYQCPNCQAPLAYVPNEENIRCEYCETEFSIETLDQFYARKQESAAQAQAAKDAKWDTAQSGGKWNPDEVQHLKTFLCSSCGAELTCDENTIATECCYCGNPAMIPSRFNGMLKPDFIIPFKKTKDEAIAALKNFYQGKYLLPNAFTVNNRIEAIQPMYVPYWLFDSDVHVSANFKASNESLIDTTEAMIRESHFYDVKREGTMQFKGIPVDGSRKMQDAWMESIEPFDYREMVPFKAAYLAGYLADKYDVDADDCVLHADERMNQTAANIVANTVTGYIHVSMENCSVIKKKSHVSYAMAPVWILTTRYQDTPYTFVMNAQTGKLAGKLPIDTKKSILYPLTIFLVLMPCFYLAMQILFNN